MTGDHVGGLITVLEELKVKNVIISKQGEESMYYETFLDIINKKNINVIVVKKGNRLQIENNIYFDILWPEEQLIKNNVLNNNAIVTKLHYNDFSMLFTGDIEKEAEEKILEEKINLKSDVLKIAHHGSKTSSTQEFIKKVGPKISVIGVGENNNFGHPNNEVISRLKKLNSKIYRTDENGEIEIFINNSGKVKIKEHIKNV